MAVTEEAPFAIEVVEPKVPLVRGGSMGLKVRATRKPGFDAAIAVSLPWNPPGIGSSGGVTIPAKATEAEIPSTPTARAAGDLADRGQRHGRHPGRPVDGLDPPGPARRWPTGS